MDAPDPRVELAELQKLMPIPVLGLVTQPALEDLNAVGLLSARDNSGLSDMAVSITYTLWRNPKDHSDPINLADLDEQTRQTIENEPSWPRPAWIVEMAQRMRCPQLWHAVRTTWHRDPSEHSSLNSVLVNHANHILMNQYRHERPSRKPWDSSALTVKASAVNDRVDVLVNEVERSAAEIDTDPYIYAIGTELADGGVVTAVLPRAELERITIAFMTRQ